MLLALHAGPNSHPNPSPTTTATTHDYHLLLTRPMLLALHAGRAARRRDGVELAAEADAAAVAATLRMLRLIFGEGWG